MKVPWRKVLKIIGLIVLGAVVLAGVAYLAASLYLFSPRRYEAGNVPEEVANNYLLAIFRGDYEQAYGYLSPDLPNYPDSVEGFIDELPEFDSFGDQLCPYFESKEVQGKQVVVSMRVQYYDECINFELYNLSYNNLFLEKKDGGN